MGKQVNTYGYAGFERATGGYAITHGPTLVPAEPIARDKAKLLASDARFSGVVAWAEDKNGYFREVFREGAAPDDIATAIRGTRPRETPQRDQPHWSHAVFGASILAGFFASALFFLIPLAMIWFSKRPFNGRSLNIPTKVVGTAVIVALSTPTVLRVAEYVRESELGCSNAGVIETATGILQDQVLPSGSKVPQFEYVRTISTHNCKAQLAFESGDAAGYVGDYTATYTIEPTDDGATYFVTARLTK